MDRDKVIDISPIIEAKKDVSVFAELDDDDRTRFIINKMKEFNNRFGVATTDCTNYLTNYVSALSKELNG